MTDTNDIEVLSIIAISASSVNKPRMTIFDIQPDVTDGLINVVTGDFNRLSITWGYAETNKDGDLLENWADTNKLSLIHDVKLPPSFN